MKCRILSYNTQLLKQGESFLEALFHNDVDFFCLQRVPRAFVGKRPEFSVYQPLFPGCEFGTAILSRRKLQGEAYSIGSRTFSNNSQSQAVTALSAGPFRLVNLLPPYEEAPDVSALEYRDYLQAVGSREGAGPVIWVGDFHHEISGMRGLLPPGFQNHSSLGNFIGRDGRLLNLTKLIANFPLVASEKVLEVPLGSPVTHLPVIYDAEVSSTLVADRS